jgi:Phage tail tube protein
MAGLRGNVAWLMAQKQAAKGTAATVIAPTNAGAAGTGAGAFKNPFAGGNIGPVRETDRLSETDSSRDQGVAYVVTSGVEGSPEMYARDATVGFWLHAALGADAPTGTTPNFTHVITPANALPYLTVWRNIGDTLWEQYRDCKVGSLTISAEAGAPLTVSAGIQGLKSTRLTADPSTAPAIAIQSGSVYNFNDAAVTLSGGATALVRSFELTIENNISRQQTDDVEPYDIVEGTREVSLGFDLIFESLDEYNKFHYGGAAGTTVSKDIFTTAAVFTFTKGVNNEIAFNLPSIAYEEFPVEPSAAGDPVVASVRAVGMRSGSPIVTATVKNQIAGY